MSEKQIGHNSENTRPDTLGGKLQLPLNLIYYEQVWAEKLVYFFCLSGSCTTKKALSGYERMCSDCLVIEQFCTLYHCGSVALSVFGRFSD